MWASFRLGLAGHSAAERRFWDADRWLMLASWAVVALSGLQVLLFAFGRDQGIFAVVGHGLLQGQVPYRDVWDFKPPGIYFAYALSEALFGKAMTSERILEVVGMVATVFAFGELGKEFFGARAAGILAGAVAALIHAQLEFWHSGQPEVYGGMLTVFAVLVAARAQRLGAAWRARRRHFVWGAVGLLFGCAFLLKPPLGGGAIVCAAYLGRGEVQRTGARLASLGPILVVGFASLLPPLITAILFWAVGAWPAVEWTFLDFAPGYTAIGPDISPLFGFYYAFVEVFTGFSAVIPAGVVAAIVLSPIHGREREGLMLLLGIICMHVAGIAMQGKFFQYHYAATLPLTAFISAAGLYKTWRRALRFRVAGVTVWCAAFAILAAVRTAVRANPGTFWERSAARMAFLLNRDRERLDARLYFVADYDFHANKELARYISAATAPDASIFVWGFEPDVYFLSDRRPASRFIYNVAQRTQWGRARSQPLLLRDLHEDPPQAIVVEHGDVFFHVTGGEKDSAEALADFPALAGLLREDYRFIKSIDKFDVYLNDAAPHRMGEGAE